MKSHQNFQTALIKTSSVLKDLLFNRRKSAMVLIVCTASFSLIGCDKPSSESVDATATQQNSEGSVDGNSDKGLDDTQSKQLTRYAQVFSGCYTVNYDTPAQIKISEQGNGFAMQMKEPSTANRVWDTPEPLETLPLEQISKYFSIEADKVTHMIGRADNMLVLAHIEPTYVNLNPKLDSEYLAFIYKGANTIYKVECDSLHSDEDSAESL